MKQKSSSQALHRVDPGLTVVRSGRYPHRRGKKAIKLEEISTVELDPYVPHRPNDVDWNNAAGELCDVCGKESVRLVPYGFMGKRKACPECIERRRALMEYKSRVVAPRFRRGR